MKSIALFASDPPNGPSNAKVILLGRERDKNSCARENLFAERLEEKAKLVLLKGHKSVWTLLRTQPCRHWLG